MNRLGIIGRLGAVLLSTMAHGGWPAEIAQGQRGSGKSRAAAMVANHRFKNMGRPTAKRWWHDSSEFYQSNALEAATAKRQRRESKRHNIFAKASSNPAHRTNYEYSPGGRVIGVTIPASLSPTYVAK